MGKAIKIKLVPKRRDKLYTPLPGYKDLEILMNQLHFHSVNETLQEEKPKINHLELHLHQTQNTLNNNYEEESTLNVLVSCLEEADRVIKKQIAKEETPNISDEQIKEFNNILEESDLKIKEELKRLESEVLKKDYKEFVACLRENINLINNRKEVLAKNNKNLKDFINKVHTIKENINSSTIDIDSLEVAFKSLKIT